LAQIVKIARQSFLSSEQIIQALGSKNKLADKKFLLNFLIPQTPNKHGQVEEKFQLRSNR